MRMLAVLLGLVACTRATPGAPPATPPTPEVPLPAPEHRTEVGDRMRPLVKPLAIPQPGAKLTLVNYFATWCPSSHWWMSVANDLQKKYAARGLVVIGVAHWQEDGAAKSLAFARENGATYPVFFDEGRQLADRVHPLSWGQSLVGIDPGGVVRYVHVGSSTQAFAEVDAELDALLPR